MHNAALTELGLTQTDGGHTHFSKLFPRTQDPKGGEKECWNLRQNVKWTSASPLAPLAGVAGLCRPATAHWETSGAVSHPRASPHSHRQWVIHPRSGTEGRGSSVSDVTAYGSETGVWLPAETGTLFTLTRRDGSMPWSYNATRSSVLVQVKGKKGKVVPVLN
jgi:hypothetical protein